MTCDNQDDSHLVAHSISSDGSHCLSRKDFTPVDLYASSTQNDPIYKSKSNATELSRIISGIKDDRQQDADDNRTKSVYDAEEILMEQLSKTYTTYDQREKRQDTMSINEANQQGEEQDSISDGPLPDQGYAWVIAFAAMCAVFTTWGANSSYGVFLNYYLDNDVFDNATEYDYALIGGMVTFLAQFLAPFSVILCNIFGFRIIGLCGIVIQTIGYMVASVATDISTLYATQGFLVGLSFSLIFIPATLIVASWFHVKKGTAMGITVGGVGLGGIVFSLSINQLIKVTGDQKWALRMVGFVALVTGLIAIALLKPRNYKPLPYSVTLKKEYIWKNVKSIIDIKVFNNYVLIVLSFWFSLSIMGYTLMLLSISSYASLVGLSPHQGSILTALLNLGQTFGRPGMGFIADRYGRFNIVAIVNLIIVIFIFAWWINATTFLVLAPFALIFGCIIGMASTFAQSLASDIISDHIHDLPAVWSGLNIFVSFFCLVAEVIALAVKDNNSSKPYLHTQIFAGCCFVVSFIMILIMREWMVRRCLKKRLDEAEVNISTVTSVEPTKPEDKSEVTLKLLNERVERYNTLLGVGIKAYFYRMIYPLKV